ncbi:MAG: hypothetical protein ACRDSR_22510 [Pseudonocardiaceae bacterium]
MIAAYPRSRLPLRTSARNCKISTTVHGGALHRGFRRFVGELRRTALRVI